MKDETLLPCPFCGSNECEAFAQDEDDCPYQSAIVRCFNCDAQSAQMVGKDKISRAIAAWNKRPAIQSGNSGQVPAGYVLVPVDATRAMIDAARSVEEDGYDAMHKAMIAAAPQPQNVQQNIPENISDGWTGNALANSALVMLDRIDVDDPVDDYRIEDIKSIVRHLASAPAVSDGWIPVSERIPDDRLQKAIVDACIVFLHGCDGLSKNYECDFGDAETEHSFCMAEVAKKAGVVEETGNRRWSLCKEMKDEIEAVYRKYAMRIMEAAPKVKP